MLLLVFLMVLHAQCINPNAQIDVCGTPVPTETPMLEATPTMEPTLEATPVPTETPTLAPTDTPEPADTPTPRPTLEPTSTPLPRDTPTPRPSVVLPDRPTRPTLRPGPERARSRDCLAAPPPVPDLPGIRDQPWTAEDRCGGTPEALATRYVVDVPAPVPTPVRIVVVVPVVVVTVVVTATETDTPSRPDREPLLTSSSADRPTEQPEVPVQIPGGED